MLSKILGTLQVLEICWLNIMLEISTVQYQIVPNSQKLEETLHGQVTLGSLFI